MKNFCFKIIFVLTVFSIANFSARAQTNSDFTPQNILNVMQHVGDWQLANPATNRTTGWIQAVGNVGMMALSGISGDAKYRDAMRAQGDTNHWELPVYRGRMYHADDECIGQVWTELYFLYRENYMIAPMRKRFDWILAHPTTTTNLDFSQRDHGQELWSWCDALFMAPASWLRLTTATGDERYMNFALTNFWRTTDYLYDKNENLFYRDSTFFDKREANGKKVFWSRGNGWVFAGIVRCLQYLPTNHPERPRFEKLFKDIAEKILSCQQPDGMWSASLLDPENFPMPEASGSGLFTYGLAWGVNQGLLDRAKFEPAVRRAWPALVACVNADGKLTHIQPAGDRPVKFDADSTQPYGGGVFLLAGSEVYRMIISENENLLKQVGIQVSSISGYPIYGAKVQLNNPEAFRRDSETVELKVKDVVAVAIRIKDVVTANGKMIRETEKGKNLIKERSTNNFVVMDGVSSRILESQIYSEDGQKKLLFQVDLAPHETKTFYVLDASALAAIPPPIVKTFARFVPERYDDFAWESDRIAFRAYGLALIPAEGTISSAPDVWIKKDHDLIVQTMYATKHYHEDNGSFMDDYRVGHSRGDGGLGIWDGKKLYTSSNYRNWKLITTGPIRSEFELTYDAWDVGNGRKVSETKRYSIDANSYFTKAQSTFSSDEKSPLTIGVGLAERACPTNRVEFFARDKTEGWMTYWQPEDKPKGVTAVAILLPKNSVEEFTNDDPNLPESKIHANVPQPTHEGYPPIRDQLAIAPAQIGQPFTYYFGACWDRSGDFTNHIQWDDYVKCFAERRDEPLQVTIGN